MNKNLLELYSDYLLSSFGPATATGLSALLDGQVSHDQVTRFLSEEAYTSKTLWQQVKSNQPYWLACWKGSGKAGYRTIALSLTI